MAESISKRVNFGSPYTSALTFIFVIAKLTGHFAFSWWIVFSPFLLSVGFFFLTLGFFFVLAFIVSVLAYLE